MRWCQNGGRQIAGRFPNAELLAKVDLRNGRDEIFSTAVDALREVLLAEVSVEHKTVDVCPVRAKRTSAAVSDARLVDAVC